MRRLAITAALVAITLAVFGCGGGEGEGERVNGQGSRTPAATPTVRRTAVPEVTPTPAPSVEQEVSEAYLNYWQVYADAVFDLDETRLPEAMTEPHLERTRQEIQSLRQRGRAAKIVVEHDFLILQVDAAAGTATIRDQYTNRSYEVDAETKEMVGEAAPGTVLTDTYFLVKEGGVWKVRDGIRETD
jgi:hypothetical protein